MFLCRIIQHKAVWRKMLFNIIVKINISEVPRWTVESVERIYCCLVFMDGSKNLSLMQDRWIINYLHTVTTLVLFKSSLV